MPANRKYLSRLQRAPPTSEAEWHWLHDRFDDACAVDGMIEFTIDERGLWLRYRDTITTQWAIDRPGTRPSCWWKYDSPAPRRRLGGTGLSNNDHGGYVPAFWCGVPRDWYHFQDIDTADPPVFESQAAYLKRHDLLLSGERLPADAFAPETLPETYWPEINHEEAKNE